MLPDRVRTTAILVIVSELPPPSSSRAKRGDLSVTVRRKRALRIIMSSRPDDIG